jgi:hypothetical protein
MKGDKFSNARAVASGLERRKAAITEKIKRIKIKSKRHK